MVHSIVRENNTWIFTYNEPNEIILFGRLNANVCISTNTNFTALDFDTEDELETYVDNFTEPGYYREQAETQGDEYIGESQKYPVIIPMEPEDEITDPPDEP